MCETHQRHRRRLTEAAERFSEAFPACLPNSPVHHAVMWGENPEEDPVDLLQKNEGSQRSQCHF